MDIYPNKDKAVAIEDVYMAFILSCKLNQMTSNDINYNTNNYRIYHEAMDHITNSLYLLIINGHVESIREFNILYAYETDDVIFEINFMKQDNEMAEFICDWLGYGKTKKVGIYRLRFDTADDFISFFNEFRIKSMKDGTHYKPWQKIAN